MKKIFEKTKLGDMDVKNRLLRSATWDGLANVDGTLPDEVYNTYERLAAGGVGTIVTGLTDVYEYNIAKEGNMRFFSDELIEIYRRLSQIAHKNNVKILMQINMNEYVRPKAIDEIVEIDKLTIEDINHIEKLYVDAAIRALKADFDGVQIHMAYNWLLGRFVNPRFNHRNDKYGGNTENRTRIVTEIIRRIKDKTNLLHVGTKFTFFTEIDSEEYSVKECVAVCKELEKASIDSIEVLGDHSRRELGPKYESCYLDLAKAVKSKIKNTSIILTGNNHNLEKLNEILKSEDADFFGLSRPLLNEPDLPLRWQKGDKSNSKCVSCNQCYKNWGKRCIKNKT